MRGPGVPHRLRGVQPDQPLLQGELLSPCSPSCLGSSCRGAAKAGRREELVRPGQQAGEGGAGWYPGGGSRLKEASLDSQLDNEKLSTTCMVLQLLYQICTYFVKDLHPSPPSPQLSASPAVRGGGGLGGGSVRSWPPAPWPGTAPGPRTVRGGGPAAHSETGPCWRAPALGPSRRITAPGARGVNRDWFTFCPIENLIFFLS